MDKYNSYLDGESFEDDLRFSAHLSYVDRGRLMMLTALCESKTVLHVGCCDHVEVLDDKIANASWLHGEIGKVASDLVGIDINADHIARLSKRGVEGIYAADITNLESIPKVVSEKDFEVVLVGEVIEHIDNPVAFLKC